MLDGNRWSNNCGPIMVYVLQEKNIFLQQYIKTNQSKDDRRFKMAIGARWSVIRALNNASLTAGPGTHRGASERTRISSRDRHAPVWHSHSLCALLYTHTVVCAACEYTCRNVETTFFIWVIHEPIESAINWELNQTGAAKSILQDYLPK